MRFALAVAIALFAVACKPPESPTLRPPQDAAKLSSGAPSWLVDVGPDWAPLPFPAERLAASLKEATRLRYRFDERGQAPYFLTYEFKSPDAEGVAIASTRQELRGGAEAATSERRASWRELESHAHFPRSSTRVDTDLAVVAAGTFEAARYRVLEENGPSTTVTTYWFAASEPGPPVRMTKEDDGELVLEMQLAERSRPR